MLYFNELVMYPIVKSLIYDLVSLLPWTVSVFAIGYCVWIIPYIFKKFI